MKKTLLTCAISAIVLTGCFGGGGKQALDTPADSPKAPLNNQQPLGTDKVNKPAETKKEAKKSDKSDKASKSNHAHPSSSHNSHSGTTGASSGSHASNSPSKSSSSAQTPAQPSQPVAPPVNPASPTLPNTKLSEIEELTTLDFSQAELQAEHQAKKDAQKAISVLEKQLKKQDDVNRKISEAIDKQLSKLELEQKENDKNIDASLLEIRRIEAEIGKIEFSIKNPKSTGKDIAVLEIEKSDLEKNKSREQANLTRLENKKTEIERQIIDRVETLNALEHDADITAGEIDRKNKQIEKTNKLLEKSQRISKLVGVNPPNSTPYALVAITDQNNNPVQGNNLLNKGALSGTIEAKNLDESATFKLSYKGWGGKKAVVVNSYALNSLDKSSEAKGNFIAGEFTSQTALEKLRTDNVEANYSGIAQNRWSDGQFSYQVNFSAQKGSGTISGLKTEKLDRDLPTLKLAESTIKDVAEIGESAKGFSVDSNGIVIEGNRPASPVPSSSYQLAFFGSNAEEIAGSAKVTIDNKKYDISLGAKKQEAAQNNGVSQSYQTP